MKGLLHLFRWGGAAILLLAFVAVGALCLWAGLVLGAGFVRTGASFMETAWIPEELRRNADDLVSVMPLAAAVLAAMHGGLPILFTRFSTSIVTERGTTLHDVRRVRRVPLKEFVRKLRQCATSDRPVTIRPYGFASDDPFLIPGIDPEESDELNVDAANRRARAVYDALNELISELIEPEEPGGMTVEAPAEWNTFEKMASERNSMIRVPDGSDHADRLRYAHRTGGSNASGPCSINSSRGTGIEQAALSGGRGTGS